MTGEKTIVDLATCCQGLFARILSYCYYYCSSYFSMDEFRAAVIDLYKIGDWRGIIRTLQNEEQWFCHLLWIQPSEDNLNFIANAVIESGLKGIASIGCGSGLLEWLIKSATGVHAVGLEVDRNYWRSFSKHNGELFTQQIFPDDQEFDCYSTSENYALLFCYFNFRKPFNNYVSNYKGNCIIIIGPGPGRGTHTNPEPFDPRFTTGKWILNSSQEIGKTKDFIAIYKRKYSDD